MVYEHLSGLTREDIPAMETINTGITSNTYQQPIDNGV